MLKINSPLNKTGLYTRCFSLSICTSPLIGSYFFGYTEASSPFKCLFLATTGIPCPSCGLTRSFISVAHNNIQQALDYHLFGLILFLALILVCLHLILELLLRRRVTTFYTKLLSKRRFQFTFIGAVLAYHSVRLYGLWQSGELAISFSQSPLGQIF